MSTPVQLHLTARNNADWKWTRSFVSGGQPLALIGEPRMALIDAQGRIVLDLRVGSGLVFDGPAGQLGASVPALTMQGLPEGVYSHDIQIRSGTGVDVPIAGTVTVIQGATRV